MSRRLKGIFLLSLALNIIGLGMLLGDMSRWAVFQAYAQEERWERFPHEKQALIKNILMPAQHRMDDTRLQMDAAKKDALHILVSEPFDAGAYMAQIKHINEMHEAMKLDIARAVMDTASHLTPAERETLADIVSQPPFALQTRIIR